MITEHTAKRIAVALETLVGVLEKLDHPPPLPPGSPPSPDALRRCFFCGVDHGNLPCPHFTSPADMEGR